MSVRLIGLAYGVACHGLFAVAITAMVANLYLGMQSGLGPSGLWAVAWDVLLVAQFPVLHSALLTPRGRTALRRLAPKSTGSILDTTLYATAASAQVLAVFALWAPLPGPTWTLSGTIATLATFGYGLGWLVLVWAMAEAGMGVQTGSTGWLALWRGDRPCYPRSFPTRGLHGLMRHPIYASFGFVLWMGPHWSMDRLALAIPLTLYCVVGPRLKEARYRKRYGTPYAEHLARARVPLPSPPAGPRSAK